MAYDLVCIGNALVDLEFQIDDRFLDDHKLTKGTMHLIDRDALSRLRTSLPTIAVKQQCGGSAANTAYAARSFGCEVFFTGKVAGDDHGRWFNQEFQQIGIDTLEPLDDDLANGTGQCLVLITEDAERTMNTCLSISDSLSVDLLDEEAVAQSSHTYIEGYLASSKTGHLAAKRTRELAEECASKVNVTLSDTSMVEVFRSNLETIMGNGVERLFCNLDEALHWCKTDRLDIALNELRDLARIPIITLGADGCVVGNSRNGKEISGVTAKAIDVNGAGDMFAGSFLSVIIQGGDDIDAAQFGNYAASRQVETYGSRLENVQSYKKLLQRYRSNKKGRR